jgi:hypothetical protein
MNKLIEELAKQAGAGEWGDSIVPAMMDVEKFADLIIRECIWAAQNKDDTCMDLRYCRALAAGKIREHFRS